MPTNQQEGRNAERLIEQYLQSQGLHVWRTKSTSLTKAERYKKRPDIGDLDGMDDWAIEVKSMGQNRLGAAMDQVAEARLVSGKPWSVLFLRRKLHNPARWYAVSEAAQWVATARLLDETGPCEQCGGGAA
jgi:Holliday junction resolvase